MANPIGSILGALKYVPATVARKALEKVNPKFKNYFASATAYGFDANNALNYITDRFESEAQRDYKQQLEKGAANQTLRPDQMVSRSQMSNAEVPAKLAKTALGFGAGAALARGAQEEQVAQPSEQPNQPPQGAGMATPNSGGAPVGAGVAAGQSLPQQVQNQTAQQQNSSNTQAPGTLPTSGLAPFDFLAQYNPQLARIFDGKVQSGSQPGDVATILKSDKSMSHFIKQIEKDTGEDFVQLMDRIYKGQNYAQQGQSQKGGRANQMKSAGVQSVMQMTQQGISMLDKMMGKNG